MVRPVGGGHLSAWLANNRPVVVSERLTVCFPWSEFDGDEPDTVVEIDPGGPSAPAPIPPPACCWLSWPAGYEAGSGCSTSGAAAECSPSAPPDWVREVTAVDITDEAVTATRRNAIRNGVGTDVHVSATPVERLSGRFDAIVANIGAAVLIELASALQSRLDPDGWLALSGLSPGQVSKVAAAYSRIEISASPCGRRLGRARRSPSGRTVRAPARRRVRPRSRPDGGADAVDPVRVRRSHVDHGPVDSHLGQAVELASGRSRRRRDDERLGVSARVGVRPSGDVDELSEAGTGGGVDPVAQPPGQLGHLGPEPADDDGRSGLGPQEARNPIDEQYATEPGQQGTSPRPRIAGIIGAFLARGLPAHEAAALGAHLHGQAAGLGPSQGLVAGDLPGLLARLLSELAENSPGSEGSDPADTGVRSRG